MFYVFCGVPVATAPCQGWWAGRDNAALTEPVSSPENCLKSAQNPTCQVHAVLACALLRKPIFESKDNLLCFRFINILPKTDSSCTIIKGYHTSAPKKFF